MKKTNDKTNENRYTAEALSAMTMPELLALYAESVNDWQRSRVHEQVKSIVAEGNKKKVAVHVEAIASKGDIVHFLRNQFCEVDSIAVDTEAGLLSVIENGKTARVSLNSVQSAYRKQNGKQATMVADKSYLRLVKAFTDNIALYLCKPVENETDAQVEAELAFHGVLHYGRGADGKRKEYDFDKHSKTALVSQLDAIFQFIAGTDARIHATRKDVAHILRNSVTVVAGTHNTEKVKSASALMRYILDAMYCRLTNTDYILLTSAKEAKKKEVERAEEAIAKTAPKCPNAFTGKNGESKAEVDKNEQTAKTAREVSVNPKADKAAKEAAEKAAKRSAAAKKASETRKRNKAAKEAAEKAAKANAESARNVSVSAKTATTENTETTATTATVA